jgi:hypothetical protein
MFIVDEIAPPRLGLAGFEADLSDEMALACAHERKQGR